jgi:predicted patatin/cPLA2 family phospholipase
VSADDGENMMVTEEEKDKMWTMRSSSALPKYHKGRMTGKTLL